MRPRNQNVHRTFQVLFDLVGLCLAWKLTIGLRIFINPIMSLPLRAWDADLWAPRLDLILLLWVPVAFWLKIYSVPRRLTWHKCVLRGAEAAVVVSCITIVTVFFSRGFGAGTSRSFVVIFAPTSFVAFVLARLLSPAAALLASKRWASKISVAVLGHPPQAMRIADRILRTEFAPHIKGIILPEAGGPIADASWGMPILGTTGQLAEVINRERLDRIILLNGSIAERELESFSTISRRMGITVSCAVGMAAEADDRLDLSVEYGLPLVDLRSVSFTPGQEALKRIFDVIASCLVLILLLPVMLVIAVLIKLTSPGPFFYTAPRVGKGGRHFSFFKFRSMRVSSPRERAKLANEKDGHIFKIKNDPRVTPLGRFLRRYSLDELPQLLNVLRGEMSLVGPRPLPAEDLDPDGMSSRFANWSEQRSRVNPGISGLWQIKGRSELDFEDMMRFDIEYIRNWSLLLDLKILLATPGLVMRGRGAC